MHDERSKLGKMVGCAVRGPKHEEKDGPCQDAWDGRRLSDNRFVIAVGDGLGSASLSHEGSALATEIAAERLEAYVSGAERIEQGASRAALKEAVTAAREAVFQEAEDIDEPATELNTTLLVVAGGPSGVASAVVGDGGIVGRIDGENELLVPREREVVDTEYSSVTVPLLHNEWEESYRFGYEPDCDAVAVFSDGIDQFTWDGLDAVKDQFFDQVFDLVRSSADLEATTEQIREYLDSDHHRKYSDDDKTLAVGILPHRSEKERAESERVAAAEGESDDEADPESPDDTEEESGDDTPPNPPNDTDHASWPAADFEGTTVATASGHVSLSEMVAEDADGCIYRVEGAENETDAVKVLAPAHRERGGAKIRAMASDTPDADVSPFAWPQEVIESGAGGDAVLGYRTSFPSDSHANALEYARANSHEDDSTGGLLDSILTVVGFGDESPATGPYESALGLARAVDRLHQQGHAVGSLHHERVLVDGDEVFLVGCEAYHVDLDGRTYDGAGSPSRYAPPEQMGGGVTAVKRADRFGLGIHIFQLLMAGAHPYQARGSAAADGGFEALIHENPFPYREPRPGLLEPPSDAPTYADLPAALRQQFERCFVEGKTHPRLRPTAKEWTEALAAVIDDDR